MCDEFSTYTVRRDGDSNIRFKGNKLAQVSTSADRASGNYSGSTGRYSELTLYRTAKGKYVCASVGFTQWQGEHDRYTAAVASDLDGVQTFFGHDRLAKRLYEAAGIDDAQEIE